ncbi:hypothetical protein HYE66_05300 [Aggregatibacter actinomycetemcomitans]|nr:hypothetical protein [Aggregatibacter actinomycetemcomitans]
MIKKMIYSILLLIFMFGTVSPAFAGNKKGSLVKKAVIAYAVYKIVTHDKKEKEELNNSAQTSSYSPYDEVCEYEDECEEE